MVQVSIRRYSLTMTLALKYQASSAKLPKGINHMKIALSTALVLLVLAATAFAGELPDAPSTVDAATPAIAFVTPVTTTKAPVLNPFETKIVDKRFLALAIVSTGSTFADSYTTLFARQNWLAGKTGVCNAEVQSAYLYGTHPTVARAYAVASIKSVGSIAASYYMKKHHSKLWSLPLIGNSLISLQGTTQNMVMCN